MDAFHEEMARRVAQFRHYLQLMESRRRQVGNDCFIIFSDDDSSSSAQRRRQRAKTRTRSRAVVLSASLDVSDYRWDEDREDESEWGDDLDDTGRFVQFAFLDKYFYMDEPNSTLFPAEAARLLQDRSGFYFACERIAHLHADGYEAEFNPVFKQYVNGDESSAAEDMAYFFFQLWNCPVDMRLYIRASDFEGKHSWENGFTIQ